MVTTENNGLQRDLVETLVETAKRTEDISTVEIHNPAVPDQVILDAIESFKKDHGDLKVRVAPFFYGNERSIIITHLSFFRPSYFD